MATQRFGHLDDFTLKNTNVGIGTSTPQDKMEVIGGTRSTDLRVAGIATFTSPRGFIEKHLEYNAVEDQIIIDAGDSGTLSGEIVVGSGQTMVVGAAATTSQGTVEALKVYDMFQPPSGRTNQRPPAKTGAIFYNFDFKTIEFFDGNSWRQVDNTTRSSRVIYAGGNPGSSPNTKSDIEFLNATTQGNSSSFGDLSESVRNKGGGSSSTRGIFSSGASPNSTSNTDVIEYVTIQSAGDSIDFGNSTAARRNPGGASNSTRFLTAGGYVSSASNIIDYVEINTLGNALDFGDLRISKYYPAGIPSPIRAVFAGGTTPGNTETMSFVKFASKGNGVNFGELSSGGGNYQSEGVSDGVRGVLAGVYNPSATYISTIEYLTIASEGNTTHFGNLTVGRSASGSSGGTRGIFAAGSTGSNTNIIDFITIASTGNASDFGDMTDAMSGMAGVSDAHGGLGGF